MASNVQTYWVRPVRSGDTLQDEILQLSDYDHTMPPFNIPIAAVYSLSGDIDKETIAAKLKDSLGHTLGQYKPFGGRMHVDEKTGRCSVIISERDVVEFSVEYHDSEDDGYLPTYDDFEREAFPPILLDTRKVLPRVMTEKQVLTQHGDFVDDNAPVSMFKLTFIRGGLILGVGLHHLCSDVSGLDGFLQGWAANTRNMAAGLPLAAFDATILDRSQLTYSGPPPSAERMSELSRRLKYVKLLDAAPQPPPADFVMPATSEVLFHFSKLKIEALKSAASLPGSNRWVSSYDCIMAFCWRCVTRARLPSFSAETVSALMHAVNGRRRLSPPLPEYYIGNVAMHGRPDLSFGDIIAPDALPRLAALVRETNHEIDGALYHAAAEWVAGVPEKQRIALNMNAFLGPDIGSTSWQGLTAHQTWDFGFGTPKAVRWPKPDLDGFVIYFPSRYGSDQDQGVELIVCLKDDATQRLLQDDEWMSYAVPRGPTSSLRT